MEALLHGARCQLLTALNMFFASVADYPGFAPARSYTPKEREPLDAMSDRYLRGFEAAPKLFRTWERLREAAPSDTFRDLLLRAEKVGLISSTAHWIALRDLRNRIAHEYLPGEIAKIYAAMVSDGAPEFRRLREAVERLQ